MARINETEDDGLKAPHWNLSLRPEKGKLQGFREYWTGTAGRPCCRIVWNQPEENSSCAPMLCCKGTVRKASKALQGMCKLICVMFGCE